MENPFIRRAIDLCNGDPACLRTAANGYRFGLRLFAPIIRYRRWKQNRSQKGAPQ